MTPERERQIRSDAAYDWNADDGEAMNWADDCKVLLAEIDALRQQLATCREQGLDVVKTGASAIGSWMRENEELKHQLAEAQRLRKDVMAELNASLKDEFDARKLLGEAEAEVGRLLQVIAETDPLDLHDARVSPPEYLCRFCFGIGVYEAVHKPDCVWLLAETPAAPAEGK